jgi:small subunit ribosomal protein S1
MTDENFDELNEESFEKAMESTLKETEVGELISGFVVCVEKDRVIVDIGYKTEAILPIAEFKVGEEVVIKDGDKIPLLVTKFNNDKPIVSYRKALSRQKVVDYLEKNGEDLIGKTIKVKVVDKNNGGFILRYDEIDMFLPKSLSALHSDKNHIDREIEVEVVNIKQSTIVCSRIKHIKEKRKKVKEFLEEMTKEDKVITGTVTKVVNYGIFVDIGPMEGLVHHSEISYKGSVNPMKIFTSGDKVDVKIIEFNKKKNHISLSVKKTMSDPWISIEEELEVGYAIEVTVSNIEPYGVFVDLGNDLEGFLHISEITWDKNIKHPKDHLKIDDVITVEIIEIDLDKRQLRVSQKKLQQKPFDDFMSKNRVGDLVKGKVVTLTNFGAFIRIGSIDGLLLNSNASWDRDSKCTDLLSLEEEIEVKILSIDKDNEKISLDRKTLLETPIFKYSQEHKINDTVSGIVKDIKDFGIFVELEKGIHALLRKEDLSDDSEEIEVGSTIAGAITFLDVKNNKIRISSKKITQLEEKNTLKLINDDSKITFGDLLKK